MKRKPSQNKTSGNDDRLTKLVLDLRRDILHELQQLRDDLGASLRPRLVKADSRLETLFAAISANFDQAAFTAALVLEAANEKGEEAKCLQQALRAVLPGSRLTARCLSRVLFNAPSLAGRWRLEIDKIRTNEGRFFRVIEVTDSVTVCHLA